LMTRAFPRPLTDPTISMPCIRTALSLAVRPACDAVGCCAYNDSGGAVMIAARAAARSEGAMRIRYPVRQVRKKNTSNDLPRWERDVFSTFRFRRVQVTTTPLRVRDTTDFILPY